MLSSISWPRWILRCILWRRPDVKEYIVADAGFKEYIVAEAGC